MAAPAASAAAAELPGPAPAAVRGRGGCAAASSSVLPVATPDGPANRYDAPVSETDVGRADHQPAGWIELGEIPSIDSSRVLLAR